jgi:hypothetical protein
VLWIVFVATDSSALAWMAFGILLVVAVVGSTNFVIWQQRRAGVLRATRTRWDLTPAEAADERIPAEQHFPVAAVVLHGLLALATLALVLAAAIDSGAGASPSSPAATGPAVSIAATRATVQGTTGYVRGAARFEFGPTVRRGRSIPAVAAGGDAVSATLTGLLPSTLYHYRLVVRRSRRTDAGTDRTFVTKPPRRVSVRHPSLRPRRFRAARGSALRFSLGAPATVRVGVYRVVPRRGRAPRVRRVATVVLDGRAGPNVVAFGGRPEIAALAAGRYRARLVAAVAGGRPSAPVDLSFRLVGRR